jgi:hypothetical protein
MAKHRIIRMGQRQLPVYVVRGQLRSGPRVHLILFFLISEPLVVDDHNESHDFVRDVAMPTGWAARPTGGFKAPVDHQHRRLHGAGAEPVQGLLAGVISSRSD